MNSPVRFSQGAFQLYYQNKPVLHPALGKLAVQLATDARHFIQNPGGDTIYEKEISYSKRVVNNQVQGVFIYAHPQSSLTLYRPDQPYLEGTSDQPVNSIRRLDLETLIKEILGVFAFNPEKEGGHLLYWK